MVSLSLIHISGGGDEYIEPTEQWEGLDPVEETPVPTIEPGEGFTENGSFVTRDLLYDKHITLEVFQSPFLDVSIVTCLLCLIDDVDGFLFSQTVFPVSYTHLLAIQLSVPVQVQRERQDDVRFAGLSGLGIVNPASHGI